MVPAVPLIASLCPRNRSRRRHWPNLELAHATAIRAGVTSVSGAVGASTGSGVRQLRASGERTCRTCDRRSRFAGWWSQRDTVSPKPVATCSSS
eukprot:2472056-Prymnesium_polylepis.1